MSDPHFPNSWNASEGPERQGSESRSRGSLFAAIVLGAIIVIVVAAGIVGLGTTQHDSSSQASDPSFAGSTSEETTTESSASKNPSSEEAASGNTTVTETVESSADSGGSDTDAARQHRRDRADYPLVAGVPADKQVVPQCDGRAVLIVQSVMANSGNVAGEINAALANNPSAVLYPPGVCPSIRGSVGGTEIHPVVVDYGNNLSGLCAAEAAAGDANVSNARILDQSANQESPC